MRNEELESEPARPKFLIPHSSFFIKPQAYYSGTAMCSRASPWFTTGMWFRPIT